MDTRYLTSGRVAKLVGVSKGTVLRAVQRGDLVPTMRMPGGSLRFLPAAVDTYAHTLGIELAALSDGAAAQPGSSRRRGRFSGQAGAVNATYTWRTFSDGRSMPQTTSEQARSGARAGEGAQSLVLEVLALLADSLRGGCAGVSRESADEWRIEYLYDRMGLALGEGTRDEFNAAYGTAAEPGAIDMLISEDVPHDVRFSSLSNVFSGVGSFVSARLMDTRQEVFGAIFVAYPHVRSITTDDIALLRAAGHLVVELSEALGGLERRTFAAAEPSPSTGVDGTAEAAEDA
jgi:excisionase family DNA binding protein